MGNSNFRQASQSIASADPKEFLQKDLPKFISQNLISKGKFMKTFHGKMDGTNVIVKIYFRSLDDDLIEVGKRLSQLWLKISHTKYPNLLPYQMWLKSNNRITRSNTSPTYLIRQYLLSNLHDRLSTRPFLHDIEKRFLIFQILKALEICHDEGVCHGDISPENIMVTSWNWLVLTDFSPFKPVMIPVDDPADFNFFYDSMGRKRCYVSPERFYAKSSRSSRNRSSAESIDTSNLLADYDDSPSSLKPSMDVYAAGCTIAEIFLSGEPLLDLASTLQYVGSPPHITNLAQEDCTVVSNLNRIKDDDIKTLVCHMTQKDPNHRRTIKEYLDDLQQSGSLPLYFNTLLYDLSLQIHWQGNSPDDRIRIVCENFGDILLHIADEVADDSDYKLTSFFQDILKDTDSSKLSTEALFKTTTISPMKDQKNSTSPQSSPIKLVTKSTISTTNQKEKSLEELTQQCKELIDYLTEHATTSDDLPSSLENPKNLLEQVDQICKAQAKQLYNPLSPGPVAGGIFEMSSMNREKGFDTSGLLLVVQIICSNIRHLRFPQSKIAAVLLFLRFGHCCNDDIILQRIVPFVVTMLDDPIAAVKATAIRTLRALLVIVKEFTSLESNLFQYYIFPALNRVAKDPDAVVRIAFAESIGSFAETSKRFLDKSFALQMKKTVSEELSKESAATAMIQSFFDKKQTLAGSIPILIEGSYDMKLKYLHDQVSRWIRDLVLDSNIVDIRKGSGLSSHSSMVKRVLLIDSVRLCVFFGQESTMDILIPQLLTFLNDQDWELRYAFCAKISAICVFVGPTVTSKCIIPCIENAVYDVEEMVVCRAISCLSALIELSLLPHSVAVSVFKSACHLLLHPSSVIRHEVVRFVAVTANLIGDADAFVFLLPLITSCLKYSLVGAKLTYENIEASLKANVPRNVYRKALHSRLTATGSRAPNEFQADDSLAHWFLPEKTSSSQSTPEKDDKNINVNAEKVQSINQSLNASGGEVVDEKLKFMLPYIDAAAREITTKTMQWKNGLASGASTLAGVAATVKRNLSVVSIPASTPSPIQSTSLEGLLEVPSNMLPDPHSLFIPSQKLGASRPREEEKKLSTIKIRDMDITKLSTIFAISNSLSDAARVLSGEFLSTENSVDSQFISTSSESVVVATRIKSLCIPPLSPDFGDLCQPDGRPYSMYTDVLDMGSQEPQSRLQWRPRENVLVTSMCEHNGSINRLAVCRDQSFFASASSDKTVKVWPIRSLDKGPYPRSALTYDLHRSPVTDLCVIENTHSIASCAENGSIHVWRVELGMQKEKKTPGSMENETSVLSVLGSSHLKKIDPNEGSLLGIQHFNSESASVLLYATQKGLIHAWDLRSATEPFVFPIRPELGAPSSIALAPDKNWIVAGTTRGYIALWDIRFNIMNKLWRHSSGGHIRRIACCKPIPRKREDIMQYTEGAYLFVAAGENETAVWGIPEGGECYKCFRSLSMAQAYDKIEGLPTLNDIELPPHPNGIITRALSDVTNNTYTDTNHSVRAIMGRISHTGLSYLFTAGTDRNIRFWDFMSPNRCMTVSGLDAAQPKGCYETPSIEGLYGKLYMCLDSTTPSPNTMLRAQLPLREGRGALPVVSNFRDAILDLKSIDVPTRMVLSCSKSGEIKIWR